MSINDQKQRRRRSNQKQKEMNYPENEYQVEFQDGELSQLDHSSNIQKVNTNKGLQSRMFQNIYFNRISLREYITLVRLDEFTNPIVLKDNENIISNIRDVIQNIFNELSLYENSLLVCKDSLRNKYVVYFHNCDLMPFSYCCNQPVLVVLDKFGSGKVKCQNSPNLCKNQGVLSPSFKVNLNDPYRQNNKFHEQVSINQINQKYSKEISKRVINGSYKVFNIQQKIKSKNKELKKFIDEDIYKDNQMHSIIPTSHNNSINTINIKQIQNTLVDIQNISSSNHQSQYTHKRNSQRKDYYQHFLEKIDIPSLNVDNLIREQNQDSLNSISYLPKFYIKTDSQNKGIKIAQSSNVSNNVSYADDSFIPSALKKRLFTPDKSKRKGRESECLPQSKLSEYQDIQPLKNIQKTKEFQTLQKIRQRISSLTGHSPNTKLSDYDHYKLDGYNYQIPEAVEYQNQINFSQQIKTQASGSILFNKKPLKTEFDQLQSQSSNHDKGYNLLSQPAAQYSEISSYTNQNVEKHCLQNINENNNQENEQENEEDFMTDKKYNFKHSLTPLTYNDYKIVKTKNSPKSSNNPQQKPSLSPSSARNANDHNKLHVFQSVLRKQLKPYKDIVQQLGIAPQMQSNILGNYKNSITMQKGIIPSLL
ncbi:hypothetical protein TTHERM_00091530 (macronuclear) [Tetrahymena thermophila SB210]|uniref:Uncharacterized protein n=1 Tax=Tetrahymena thermophila (strain SB210) TaxID=312017 RepID=Q236E0_TETTS|nr:hypothetical protein TTHERM_00091530 [Tetrahymena thermophila SB210]EAR92560.2 hypothetical protein TTHERM_00091530 [Tetrahymena thermophila SB210]|eukprot:XP_001012805.2 hypothetical protein TTHERM_00091530 [Tetrahymena thermophila SB210]